MQSDVYKKFLLSLLTVQLPAAEYQWLQQQLSAVSSEKDCYRAFGLAPRFISKQPLQLTADHLAEADGLRAGFDPRGWSVGQAARTVLLLQAPASEAAGYLAGLNHLFAGAELSELVTLYAALPLLPYPAAHVKRAAEGVRTTMTSVFDAIALHNPYPHDFLPVESWNQLVLKAVFNARPLHQIYGLDRRRNAALAHMLIDYAHERWAAGRTLTPEVWRLVAPYLTAEQLPDMQRLLSSANELEKQAATLALTESDLPVADELLRQHRPCGPVTWQSIGERAYAT